MNHEKIQFLDSMALDKRLTLIEDAFEYQKPHSFYTDFYPLFGHEFDNGYLCALYNDQLIGHLAFCQREIIINNQKYKVIFLGGIAVDKNFRGNGIFKLLMNKAIKKLENSAHFFMLWSGDAQMYERFGFKECGAIYQWSEGECDLSTRTLDTLSKSELQIIANLYEQTWPNRILRSEAQWLSIKNMKSVEVFFNHESYAFIGKGFDLGGVIHEYGTTELDKFQNFLKNYKVWSPRMSNNKEEVKLWLGLARPGNLWSSSQEISQLLNQNEIMIGGIDSI